MTPKNGNHGPGAWDLIRAHLNERKRTVAVTIGTYPPPITGCDAQYNHLLEERDRLRREMERLDEAERTGGADPAHAADAFVRSSDAILGEAAKELRRRLAGA